jgi:DNA-binding transcriptional LysR family regulator
MQTTDDVPVKQNSRRMKGKIIGVGKRLHDNTNPRITLRQWRIFHAVYDCGGFAEAGARLHLGQSTVSYTISCLQEQLGVPLFQIEGRRAIVTTAGRWMLERSQYLLREAVELEERSGASAGSVLIVAVGDSKVYQPEAVVM